MPHSRKNIVKAILADLERDTRINLHQYPIRVGVEDDTLVLRGIVGNIAAKRLAHHVAHRHAGDLAVRDHVRVIAPEPGNEGKLREEIVALLEGESVFNSCGLTVREGDRLEILRPACGEWGSHRIEIEVRDGTVILSGDVLSLTHRRVAEALAWWAAGCEAVENHLHVVPPEQETDGELADAVRLVVEKDPLVHADRLSITARNGVVTLQGLLASNEERLLAEQDAWYVSGVRDVVNGITVGG